MVEGDIAITRRTTEHPNIEVNGANIRTTNSVLRSTEDIPEDLSSSLQNILYMQACVASFVVLEKSDTLRIHESQYRPPDSSLRCCQNPCRKPLHSSLCSIIDKLETYTQKIFNLFAHQDIQPRIPTNKDYEELRDELQYALDVPRAKKRLRVLPPTSRTLHRYPSVVRTTQIPFFPTLSYFQH